MRGTFTLYNVHAFAQNRHTHKRKQTQNVRTHTHIHREFYMLKVTGQILYACHTDLRAI